jgi:hypothetical protein
LSFCTNVGVGVLTNGTFTSYCRFPLPIADCRFTIASTLGTSLITGTRRYPRSALLRPIELVDCHFAGIEHFDQSAIANWQSAMP